jgi:chemotaxis signal transduction protein
VYLAYLLRQEIFALTTLRIVDVVANDALISPPHSTGFVCGIVAFLDRTVPVVDLDADVDRTADGSGGRAHIVILETIGLDRRDFIGILLDGSRMESEARTSHSLLRS